jgi:hypothetical protein
MLPEIGGELLDRGATAQRLMQGVFKTDLRGGQLIDDIRVPWVTPKLGEPAPNNGLIGLLQRHERLPSLSILWLPWPIDPDVVKTHRARDT